MIESEAQTVERCDRCRQRLDKHGTAIVDRRTFVYICPTADGYAVGEA